MNRIINTLWAGVLMLGLGSCEPAPDEQPVDEAAEPAREVAEPAAELEDAPEAATATVVEVDRMEPYGAYLTDAEGRALYLFTADSAGRRATSSCYAECADAWPPLLTEDLPSAGAAPVQTDLLGTIVRRDGTTQATYNGWPLYYFVQDQGPGTATGQDVHGFGGGWYLISPEGQKIEAEAEATQSSGED